MGLGLYKVDNPYNAAADTMAQASNSYGAMQKAQPGPPEKTVGGGIMSGVGGAYAASQMAQATGIGMTTASGAAGAAGAAGAGAAGASGAAGAAGAAMAVSPWIPGIGAALAGAAYFLS